MGTVLQDEGDGYVDFVTLDIAVIDEDVHVLHPTTLHVAQRLARLSVNSGSRRPPDHYGGKQQRAH